MLRRLASTSANLRRLHDVRADWKRDDGSILQLLPGEPVMPQFRKKPVVIDAMQFTGGSCTNEGDVPEWFVAAVLNGTVRAFPDHVSIGTLEGEMHASPGDWIIKGVKNELYPCKPDIFAATYEAVEQ
jgi:hypothetical protein